MTARIRLVFVISSVVLVPSVVTAQTSSLGAIHRRNLPAQSRTVPPREEPPRSRNVIYEQFAWTSLAPTKPRTYKPGDLVTVIVREQRTFEAESDLETKRRFNVKSELDAFVKPTAGGLGAAAFRRGRPNVDYELDQKLKSEGDTSREDRMITRLTTQIIDVKPNGILVLEGRALIEHDEEISRITLTGTCRKEDITPDNTVLSTQMADKHVVVENKGALRASSSRGWVTRLLDLLKPI